CLLPSLFFLQAEDGIRAFHVTGVQTCALPILLAAIDEGRKEMEDFLSHRESELLVEICRLLGGDEAPAQGAEAWLDEQASRWMRSEERRVGRERRRRGAEEQEEADRRRESRKE